MPHGVEVSYPQQFLGLAIQEDQVTLNIMVRIDILIILDLETSFIFFDSYRGISTLLI
jgi:hypothetical protein